MTQAEQTEIENLARIIFHERCPGIRYMEEDRPLYEEAAKAALAVLNGIVSK